ncbi:MAG: prepilin-type N-terminal cleavage/methylation domain-containing protein [Sedimentisphaerales bacterium]|nr:prepilin-type N-terminal cleavage/methylation domain-containing protein [Sedimentisphaerales bacterium]
MHLKKEKYVKGVARPQFRLRNRVLTGRRDICRHCGKAGFTLVEIMIVVVIIAIAAMMAIPMVGSAAGIQVRAAANMVAADLEYAKNMAISKQKIYSVVFDETNESYQIEDVNGLIEHPVKKGFQYAVNFSQDSRVDRVDIVDADFDSTSTVKFDYLGSPYNGSNNPLNSGVITLQAAGTSVTVTVEPVTGYVRISD